MGAGSATEVDRGAVAGAVVGVGNGMFDAGTGTVTETLVGVTGAAFGVSMADTAGRLSVGGGSSPHADSTAAANKHSSPMLTLR